MRRLWSYIILAFTSIVLMGASFVNIFSRVNSNIEYAEGRELVFRISDKDNPEIPFEDDTAVNNIAEKMIERLEAQDVTQYRVSTQGFDTVTVELKQDTTSNYANIQTLLAFNGSLALTSKVDGDGSAVIGDEFLSSDKAYMKTEENVPAIYIPVNSEGDINKIYEVVNTYKNESNTDAGETTGEGDDATTSYYIYMWHDYDPDNDTYAKTQSGDEFDPHVAEKLFMKFDVSALKENEEDKIEYLKTYVNIQDKNSNSKYEASEVKAAYDTAKFYINLINSGELDYKVTFLFDNVVSAWSDQIITIDNSVAWSKTLIATLVGIAIVSLLLVTFFRLGALANIVTTLGSVYGAIGMIVIFSAEFNAATLIAFLAVAIVSLASGIIYNIKFKEECYRGRSLKKANSEGAKKSLLPIVDIHVAIIAIGIFSYIFGGAIMRGFAVVAVLGGLISLLLNTLVLRGLMWLPTNTTKLQNKYNVFNIDNEKVPNVIKEEKQQYFGPFAEKKFTKHTKIVAIVAGVVLVAGVAGLSAFGAVNKGVIFNNGSSTLNTQIYIETQTKNTAVNLNKVEDALKETFVYKGEDEANAKALSTYVALNSDGLLDIDYQTRTDTDSETKEEITYNYYVIQLNTKVDLSEMNGYSTYTKEGVEVTIKSADYDGLEKMIDKRFEETVDSGVKTSIKVNTAVNSTAIPDFMPIFWGTLVGIAVTGLYLLLRYRLSRGLVALIAPLAVSVAATGIFALTRLPVSSYAAVALPFIAIFTFVLEIIFMNREREMVLEDKAHDKSVENRQSIMEKATSLAFYPMLAVFGVAFYIAVNFYGFGDSKIAWIILVCALGMVLALVAITALFGPLSQLFYKLFFKVDTDKITSKFKAKKKVKKVQTKNKSAEPEEYTFIGIND